jgi:hypothetical protein
VPRLLSYRKSALCCFTMDESAEEEYCGHCGETDPSKLHTMQDVPCFYNHYTFCNEGKCVQNYTDFRYSFTFFNDFGGYTDLKGGIPYCYSKKNPYEKQTVKRRCDYCNAIGYNVIVNTRMPGYNEHNNFCMNDSCCNEYIRYLEMIKVLPHTPQCFKKRKLKGIISRLFK